MTGGIEATGDVVVGSLLGRAVEPAAGGAAQGDHASAAMCLNCGTALIDQYCHRCGQNGHVHRSLGAIGHDLLHGVFHFEGKIWRTLPMLVLRPGELTRRYVAGERARFVSPLAMFLFTVFLTFAMFNAFSSGDLANGLSEGLNKVNTQAGTGTARFQARVAQAEAERLQAPPGSPQRAKAESELEELRAAIRTAEQFQATASPGVRIDTGIAKLDKGLNKAKANPGLVLYKIQSNAYKFSWALILLSTPLVAMLFLWRRGYHMYDHAVFVTYSITFMSLLTMVLELGMVVTLPGWLLTMLVLAVPVHLFAQLKGAYRLNWFSAAWRTVIVLWMATFALTIFITGLVTMGLLG